jgi:hypothetical protein
MVILKVETIKEDQSLGLVADKDQTVGIRGKEIALAVLNKLKTMKV